MGSGIRGRPSTTIKEVGKSGYLGTLQGDSTMGSLASNFNVTDLN